MLYFSWCSLLLLLLCRFPLAFRNIENLIRTARVSGTDPYLHVCVCERVSEPKRYSRTLSPLEHHTKRNGTACMHEKAMRKNHEEEEEDSFSDLRYFTRFVSFSSSAHSRCCHFTCALAHKCRTVEYGQPPGREIHRAWTSHIQALHAQAYKQPSLFVRSLRSTIRSNNDVHTWIAVDLTILRFQSQLSLFLGTLQSYAIPLNNHSIAKYRVSIVTLSNCFRIFSNTIRN